MSSKIILKVCRSCIRDNPQSDPCFLNEATLKATYQKKIKKPILGEPICELRLVDCLTNCQNPNSVQIERDDGDMLLGSINSQKNIDQVIELVKTVGECLSCFGSFRRVGGEPDFCAS
ncbi:MAG: hypothetical protein IPJ69_09355 [Deltaproteobacteria bacterium]|nr:MAG: hypothetical protein IPJ69_09355 [Deltaproteobacteria bacterium]